jgi:diacylglycerol kinase
MGQDERKRERKQPLYKSFQYAFEGLFRTIQKERNMQIHCTAAVLVVIFGIVLHISREEWFICLILFGLIMGLECVNTAIEAVVDLVTLERRPLAKKAKDAAAGAVLAAAIFAAVIGLWIFMPKLLGLLG